MKRTKKSIRRHSERLMAGSCALRTLLKIASFTFILLGARTTFAAGDIFSRDSDYDYDPPAAGSYSLPIVKVAPGGTLLDSTGKSLNLRDLVRGRVTVLS